MQAPPFFLDSTSKVPFRNCGHSRPIAPFNVRKISNGTWGCGEKSGQEGSPGVCITPLPRAPSFIPGLTFGKCRTGRPYFIPKAQYCSPPRCYRRGQWRSNRFQNISSTQDSSTSPSPKPWLTLLKPLTSRLCPQMLETLRNILKYSFWEINAHSF